MICKCSREAMWWFSGFGSSFQEGLAIQSAKFFFFFFFPPMRFPWIHEIENLGNAWPPLVPRVKEALWDLSMWDEHQSWPPGAGDSDLESGQQQTRRVGGVGWIGWRKVSESWVQVFEIVWTKVQTWHGMILMLCRDIFSLSFPPGHLCCRCAGTPKDT